jgi:C1A family cysteine protease
MDYPDAGTVDLPARSVFRKRIRVGGRGSLNRFRDACRSIGRRSFPFPVLNPLPIAIPFAPAPGKAGAERGIAAVRAAGPFQIACSPALGVPEAIQMKRISLVLVLLACASARPQGAIRSDAFNPDFIRWKALGEAAAEGRMPGETPPPFVLATDWPRDARGLLTPQEELPGRFDLRDSGGLTAVRDRGQCGACWAFAALAAVESEWKIAGRGVFDLSEDHLNTCHPPFTNDPCAGGNAYMASGCLARGSGPYSEADDPYDDGHVSIDCPSGLDPAGIVSAVDFLPRDPLVIKNTLLRSGALYAGMHYHSAYYDSISRNYFYPGSGTANHAVALIGWDDARVTAGGTGVWIVRDSRGTGWGENGIFYVAYQDAKFNSTTVRFRGVMDAEPGVNVSTFAESGFVCGLGYTGDAAEGLVRFTAGGNVRLTAIGTWAGAAGAAIGIEVYGGFDGDASLTGLLAAVPETTCDFAGYRVFDLSRPVSLAEGQDAYVRVRYRTPGGFTPIPAEIPVAGYNDPVIETGRCWTRSANGTSWNAEDEYADLAVYAVTRPDTVRAAVRVFPEGAYVAGGTLSTRLRPAGCFPAVSPYPDGRRADPVPENAVDWVSVELRLPGAAAAAVRRSFLLRSDGWITEPDGATVRLAFPGGRPGEYNLVVRQRNHCAVMSAAPVPLDGSGSAAVDFTMGACFGRNGEKPLEPGTWGMWGGDIDQDGKVTTTDYAVWYNAARQGQSGYAAADVNLDGQTTTMDYLIWFNAARVGGSSQAP